jgi:formylglycine-generating enzyme
MKIHFPAVLLAGCFVITPSLAQPIPTLSIQATNGVPRLVLSGATGAVCQVQCRDTLVGANWFPLESLVLTTSPCFWRDATATASHRFYRVMAVAPGLTLVPGGSFQMGDGFNQLGADEVPVHQATVSGFYMDRTEVSKALWDIVFSWATNRGYGFSTGVGQGKALTHPVQAVSWHDAVKWCNARSQLEGLTPCYHTNDTLTGVYSTGQITVSNSFVNWAANGHRLPTEAEWERAARGGAATNRFPWADTNVISHTRANYYAGNYYDYDKSPTIGYHPAFSNAPAPYTSPGGYFAANGFALYDLAGNVWEWCWDFHDPNWYTNTLAKQGDTHGPDFVSGNKRVARGGSYSSSAPDNCCALREGRTPTGASGDRGFRCVRRATAPDLVIIPAGSVQMGVTNSEGFTNELPQHTVYVGAFYLGRTEVTKELWDSVYTWATSHSYFFDHAGTTKAADHPVQTINWYDAVKWCNARSEMEGLTPAYYLDTSFSSVYRGPEQFEMWTNFVKWNANGYRLPTEAEWERAARGGLADLRFPWGDTITHTQANYYSSATYIYDVSPTRGYHTNYSSGGFPCTNPTGDFTPNAFGLYGMADNVGEWCWDWYDAGWYSRAAATNTNCRGPRGDGMTYRVQRGGSWNIQANKSRSAYRGYNGPADAVFSLGFRCARGL